ncbi:hypothetical protein Vadar_007259 [Vaccinium darrowii]|uniref:Uncharacterized protein n=1 Tax=Vaccinium darrowii TaxID=229202 RepID=A0ACB7XXA0_9ERIC|nr:hypothetical protein Vadar_007259 [Vaccinium darrowii]
MAPGRKTTSMVRRSSVTSQPQLSPNVTVEPGPKATSVVRRSSVPSPPPLSPNVIAEPGRKITSVVRRTSVPSPPQLSPNVTAEPTLFEDGLGNDASLEQSGATGRSLSTRVRGKTLGKGVEKLIAQNGGKKLSVPVLEEWNSLCGINASKATTLLGVYIRRMSPVKNTPTWWHIDEATQSAIIQSVLDKVNISDDYHNNPLAKKVVNRKCYRIHINWRYRMKLHYSQLVENGEDTYSSPYEKVTQEDWRHMIDDVWSSDKHKNKSEAGKKNRGEQGPIHAGGSRSFVAAMTTPPENNGYANLEFPEFYQKTHTKKDNNWISDTCAENHSQLVNLRKESSQSGIQLTAMEMSRDVLGKRKRYILGFGDGPKPTSSSSEIDVASRAHDEELQKFKDNMEKMQMEREEERKEREQERTERMEEKRQREEERRQHEIEREQEKRQFEEERRKREAERELEKRERELEKRDREEEKRQHEAEQKKTLHLLLKLQGKTRW